MNLFYAHHLSMVFGGLIAVDDFSLDLKEGELLGLIGPNGAGKTTVFNMITGTLKPTQGKIFLQGKEITGLRPNAITQRGIARTFQNIRLFQDLPVIENVMISYHGRLRSSFMGAVLGTPLYLREEREIRNGSMGLLITVLGWNESSTPPLYDPEWMTTPNPMVAAIPKYERNLFVFLSSLSISSAFCSKTLCD